jgi:hypothetical protein
MHAFEYRSETFLHDPNDFVTNIRRDPQMGTGHLSPMALASHEGSFVRQARLMHFDGAPLRNGLETVDLSLSNIPYEPGYVFLPNSLLILAVFTK